MNILHGPNACPSAYIENTLRFLDWSYDKLVVHHHGVDVVTVDARQTLSLHRRSLIARLTRCQADQLVARRWDPWITWSAFVRGLLNHDKVPVLASAICMVSPPILIMIVSNRRSQGSCCTLEVGLGVGRVMIVLVGLYRTH